MHITKDYIFSDILFGTWILAGIILDEKYHMNNKREVFWTTPHLIIYTAIIALAIRFTWAFMQIRYSRKPYSNGILAFGLIPFLLGLIGDLILHDVYNVQDESILTRPTHLLILIGFGIFLLGFYKDDNNKRGL